MTCYFTGEKGEPADETTVVSKLRTSGSEGCSIDNAGEIYLDVPNSQLLVCDGSTWKFTLLRGLLSDSNPAASCKELYDNGHELSGSFLLRGRPGEADYRTFCDLRPGTGGWTLVARAKGSTTEWAPASTLWHSTLLLHPTTATDLTATRAMKNEGWLAVRGQKIRLCYNGPYSGCAVFTHNLQVTLEELFRSKFGVRVEENYSFHTLRTSLHVTTANNYQGSNLAKQVCGLNIGDGCNLATNPNIGDRNTICRIGCIGDKTATECRLDDFALGVGVSSCFDEHGCRSTGTNTPSLHYRDSNASGLFDQTAYIYVQ
jgi:hypothetical protein